MVDMHIHSNNSDGDYSVSELVEMLLSKGVQLFSVTDHDNINSCYCMRNIVLPDDVMYVSGIEFSAFLGKYNCHILGYDFSRFDIISDECDVIKERKVSKILDVVSYIRSKGVYFSQDQVDFILNKDGSFGRMDLCRILMDEGYGTKKEIYDKYLDIPGLPTHRSSFEHISSVISSSGGISVLAHPSKIEKNYGVDISDFIEDFLEFGLDGIEVYNSVHSLSDVKRYISIAKKYNLITTGGSDFHGISHPERVLGTTTKNQKVLSLGEISFRK